MKQRFFVPLIMLGTMLLFTGCGGGGGGNNNIEDLDEQILNAFQIWATAIENEDMFTLDLITSPSFLLDGTNKAGYLAAFDEIFEDYNNIEVDILINEIDYENSSNPSFADVYYEWLVTGVNRTTGQREIIDETPANLEYFMIMSFEDSRWKLFGNQRLQPTLSTPGASGVKKLPSSATAKKKRSGSVGAIK